MFASLTTRQDPHRLLLWTKTAANAWYSSPPGAKAVEVYLDSSHVSYFMLDDSLLTRRCRRRPWQAQLVRRAGSTPASSFPASPISPVWWWKTGKAGRVTPCQSCRGASDHAPPQAHTAALRRAVPLRAMTSAQRDTHVSVIECLVCEKRDRKGEHNDLARL